jgi:phage FluMu protein Com
MNTTLRTVLLRSSLALALAVGVAWPVSVQAADQVKGAERLMMKPIKTPEDIAKVEPGDMIAMSCPKCKTITVTYVETIKGHIKEEKATQKHLCPGCETTIKTEGRGKQAKDVVVHVCKTCGSEDAFCCVMKKGSGPTKGMEKEKK